MEAIRKLCSPELLEAIRNAEIEDLRFAKLKAMPGHPLSGDIKTAYALTHIGGVPIPTRGFISYVRNDGRGGRYFYVINWLHCEKIVENSAPWPHRYCGPSEDEARQDILRELKLLLE